MKKMVMNLEDKRGKFEKEKNYKNLKILTTISINVTAIWDVTPCSLVVRPSNIFEPLG